MESQMTPMRSYVEYVAAMTAYSVTPITQDQWAEFQKALPAASPVSMPSSLNHAIAVAIEAGDVSGSAQLIGQCDEHDKECWSQYTAEGDYFPAGGLWFNQLEWMNGKRPDATPLNVAHLLDFDGELPSK